MTEKLKTAPLFKRRAYKARLPGVNAPTGSERAPTESFGNCGSPKSFTIFLAVGVSILKTMRCFSHKKGGALWSLLKSQGKRSD